MLHDFHVFLYSHRWAVLLLSAIGIIFALRIVVAHLRAPARDQRRPLAPPPRPSGKPSAKFAETVRAEDIPRPGSSVAAQLAKSRAATGRMDPVTVGDKAGAKSESDDAAMADLFSGLDDAPAAPTTAKNDGPRRGITETGAIRRVGRMEELGFHHSIGSDEVKPTTPTTLPSTLYPAAAPTTAATDATARLADPKSEPAKTETTRSEVAKPAAAAPASAGSSAAPELDAILARIDQVLSQDGKKTEILDAPAPKSDARTRPTEMMPPTATPTRPDPKTQPTQMLPPVGSAMDARDAKKSPPLWARADAFDDDADAGKDAGNGKGDGKDAKDSGTQLGLFDDKK